MTPYIPIIACGLILPVLCYGGYTDWKSRIIPNSVPFAILGLGLLTGGQILYKLLSLGVLIIVLLVTQALTHKKSGGGDLKLYMALSFAMGLQMLAILLLVTIVLYTIYRAVKHIPKETRFPVCTFMTITYGIYYAITLVSTICALSAG